MVLPFVLGFMIFAGVCMMIGQTVVEIGEAFE
jgi:hypothetical protein